MGMATALLIGGTLFSAGGTLLKGYQDKKQGEYNEGVAQQQANLMERKATETRAIGQRQRDEERRAGERLSSRARAVAAGSGAGVYNPTVLDIVGDIAEQSAFNQAAITFQHESKARGLEQSAIFERQKGAFAAQAGQGAFAGSILASAGIGAAGGYQYFKPTKDPLPFG